MLEAPCCTIALAICVEPNGAEVTAESALVKRALQKGQRSATAGQRGENGGGVSIRRRGPKVLRRLGAFRLFPHPSRPRHERHDSDMALRCSLWCTQDFLGHPVSLLIVPVAR